MSKGRTPSILLIDPKYPHNVGMAVRNASCFGAQQVWWTGDRVPPVGDGKNYRLPREERMKGYQEVELFNEPRPFDFFDDAVPVAVEIRKGSECLLDFEHPEKALYVFGPEDGGLTRVVLQHCHRVVTIPSRHCLNLAAAVALVLYDRMSKEGTRYAPGDVEGRGWDIPEDFGSV